jgi:hypothetical protein
MSTTIYAPYYLVLKSPDDRRLVGQVLAFVGTNSDGLQIVLQRRDENGWREVIKADGSVTIRGPRAPGACWYFDPKNLHPIPKELKDNKAHISFIQKCWGEKSA